MEYSSSSNDQFWTIKKSHENTFNVPNQNWMFVAVAVTDAEYCVLYLYVLKLNIHVFDSFSKQILPKTTVI